MDQSTIISRREKEALGLISKSRKDSEDCIMAVCGIAVLLLAWAAIYAVFSL